MKDFLFGHLKTNKRKVAEIEMESLKAISSTLPPEIFLRHLNRFLETAPNNTMDVVHPTSVAEPFPEILSAIVKGVDLVMVMSGEDINDIATIRMDFILESGVVSFRPHWSLYKNERINEFRASLVQVLKAGLSKKMVTMSELKFKQLDIFSGEGIELLFLIGSYSINEQSFSSDDFMSYIEHDLSI